MGIYDTGNTFANNGLIMPLSALQRLSEQPGAVTSAVVGVNSIDNVESVIARVQTALGESADVVNSQESAEQIVQPLESVKKIALFSVVASIVAGAVIILLTMIMIVRERRREIGVLKAIGASNGHIMTQFVAEAITFTLLGLVVGAIIGIAVASPITDALVSNSITSSQVSSGSRPGRPGGMRAFRTATASVQDISTSVGWEVMGLGAGVAVLIAILGSAFPAYVITKVRPAEAMRAE